MRAFARDYETRPPLQMGEAAADDDSLAEVKRRRQWTTNQRSSLACRSTRCRHHKVSRRTPRHSRGRH